MTLQSTLKKINELLFEIKRGLKEGNFELPLVKCSRQFDFEKLIMVRRNPVPIIFSQRSVSYILRVIEILMIVRNLLLNGKFITKRNLYYQLVKYYSSYLILDQDVWIICDSLKLERSNLNIIVSNNLQLFWINPVKLQKSNPITIELSYKKCTLFSHIFSCRTKLKSITRTNLSDSQRIKQTSFHSKVTYFAPATTDIQATKLPQNLNQQKSFDSDILYPKQHSICQKESKINFLLMEKQSLFEILSESLSYKASIQNCNWLLMHCKGYPDMTALQFINGMLEISESQDIQFYYIGDYDIYGIDIMLNYSIGKESFMLGNQSYKGLWQKLKWLCLFDEYIEFQNKENPGFKSKFHQVIFYQIQSEYQRLTYEDKKKTVQILARDYLQINKIQQCLQGGSEVLEKCLRNYQKKVIGWRSILQRLLQNEYQCEVESYFKNWQYPFDLIELMINKQFFIQ